MKRIIALFLCIIVCFVSVPPLCLAEEQEYINNVGFATDTLRNTEIISAKYSNKYGCFIVNPQTSFAEMLLGFEDPERMTAYAENGNIKYGGQLVETGNTIELLNNEFVNDSATIAVSGDENCDGSCTVTDIVSVISNIISDKSLDNTQNAAADIDLNGSITVTDVVRMIKLIANGKQYIVPFNETTYEISSILERCKVTGSINSAVNGLKFNKYGCALELSVIAEGDIKLAVNSGTAENLEIYIDDVKNESINIENGSVLVAQNLPKGYHSIRICGTAASEEIIVLKNIKMNGQISAVNDCGLLSTSEYCAEAYNKALWNGNVAYQESAIVVKSNDTINDISLLYKADRLAEVKSYDLKTTYVYGRDYCLTADGKIHFPSSTTIPAIAETAFLTTGSSGNWLNTADGQNAVVNLDNKIHKYQISVTYYHSDLWEVPSVNDESQKLSNVFNKLKNGEDVNMVIFGDSISVGANSSGLYETDTMNYNGGDIIERTEDNPNKIMIAPFAPTWSRALYKELQDKYKTANIKYFNHSCGSSNSENYGVKFVQSKVVNYNPDIVFLGFGTNESTRSKESFKQLTLNMVEAITTANPNCAIVLVSAQVPNTLVKGYSSNNLSDFEQSYYEIQSENPELQIAVAPVNTVSKFINTKKSFQDITGNNINHPNDYGVRVYISTLMQTLGMYN